MDQRFSDIYEETIIMIEELLIKYNREKWNFFTNATSENYNQYLKIIMELVDYFTVNQNIPYLIKESRKKKNKFTAQEKEIISKIADLEKLYAKKSSLTDDYFTALLKHQRNVINKRIQYNSKDSTTNHLADLCQRRTSLKRVKMLQKDYFFQPVNEFKAEIEEIINLRNSYFKERGYADYSQYFLRKHNMTPSQLKTLINKIDKATSKQYKEIKAQLEEELIRKFNSRSKTLPAYLYGDPFFRYYPVHIDENVNIMFKGKDIAYAVKKFFETLGVNLDSIYEVSDMYIRPGKHQNPVIIDINKRGDVRFSLNAKSNYRGIYHLLRTVSKVVYLTNMSHKIPYLLHDMPERGIVEAFTIFLTHYALKKGYISKIIAQYEEEDEQIRSNISDYLSLTKIIYLRYQLALAHFELNMYSTDKHQELWLSSIKQYQFIDKDAVLDPNGWVMIDSIIFDPFSSVFELIGYDIEPMIDKIVTGKKLHGKGIIDFFAENLMYEGSRVSKRTLKKLLK